MAARIGSWTLINSSADPLSQAIDVPANTELFVLMVGLYDTGAPAPTAVTLGGNALTLATRVTTDVGEQTGIWYLVSPPTGSQTLVFNHAGAIDEGAHFYWAGFEDVDTAGTPVSSLGSASSGSNNATVSTPTSVTADVGDLAVGIGCVFGTDGIVLTGEVADGAVFNQNDAAVGEIAGAGAAVAFTVTTGDFPAVSGIIIENAAGGGAATWGPLLAMRNNRLVSVF